MIRRITSLLPSFLAVAAIFLALLPSAKAQTTLRGSTTDAVLWTAPDGVRGLVVALFEEARIDFLFPQTQGLTGPIRGEYFEGVNFDTHKLDRREIRIDFAYGGGGPGEGVPNDNFSARWSGQIRVERTGEYTFYTQTDDGVRLTVDGKMLVDRWQDMGTTEFSGKINLQSGRTYDFKMEYYERGGGAEARLLWSGPGTPKQVLGPIGAVAQTGPAADLQDKPLRLGVMDVNADRRADVLVLSSGFPGKITTLLAKQDGFFEEGGSVSAGNDPGILVVSEGRAAVLARQSRQIIVFKPVQGKLTQVNARKLDQKLRGLENLENGFAVLGEKSVLILGEDLSDRSTISAEGGSLATGDLDGDGRADIAVLSSNGATAYYAKDNYQKPELFQGTAPGSDQATQGLIYQRKIYSSTPAGIFQMDREGALNRSDAPGRIVRGESGLFVLETGRGQIRPMP